MRTTFDLPADIAATLREESARRGGRGTAPMNLLIAEAVRKTYGHRENPRARARITGIPGRMILVPPKGTPVTTDAEIAAALEDTP
ncbi:hypothetical protein OpiT1DRAFT_00505 [Opitutaceae bacterium TAV1]|nr:hypothetical protein OpiT1DRAFT_00505 [Opitutaceae bacterium TAV1]